MIFFETPGATAAFLDDSPLVLIFKAAAILKGWWLDSQIIVDPLKHPFDLLPPPRDLCSVRIFLRSFLRKTSPLFTCEILECLP